ncbi:MAG: hypothetical protein LBU53_08390 [Zoogloeaceae bacterium]|jgi:hypothetical protein|nr:hypothetical protein [Zoogloeaceae bacterium]
MTPKHLVHVAATLCALALLAACGDFSTDTQSPSSLPTAASFVDGKTPESSLIPGVNPDVDGIRIGEPLNSDLITKLNPDYQISKEQDKNGYGGKIEAKTRHDKLLVVWNTAGLVVHIARNVTLEEGGQITPDTLKTSLLEKYGQPTFSGEKIYWSYDREGKLYADSDRGHLSCVGFGFGDGSGCGYKIEADIRTDSNDEDAVNSYSVAITYVKLIVDEASFVQKEEKRSKLQKRTEDINRAKQNKPKL